MGMGFIVNGFGTRYYGMGELRPDGSYITTTWITALYIPLLPLGSARVVRHGRMKHGLITSTQEYGVLEKVSLCWPQVLRVYIFAVLAYAWWRFDVWLFFTKLNIADRPNETINGFIFFATMLVPFVGLYLYRRGSYRAGRGA